MTHIHSNAPTLVKIQKKLSPFNYLMCSIHSRMLYLFCSSWIMLFALGILTHASSKDGESPIVSKLVWLLFALNVAQLLRVTVQDGMLYSSPHKAFANTTIRQTADELLACARTKVPAFGSEWKQIDACFKSAELYERTSTETTLIATCTWFANSAPITPKKTCPTLTNVKNII